MSSEQADAKRTKNAETSVTTSDTLELQPMKEEFFARPSHIVAKELLGHRIVRKLNGEMLVCQIVETEAYGGIKDSSSHSHRFHNSRMRTMPKGTPPSPQSTPSTNGTTSLCPITYPYTATEETLPPMYGPVGHAYVYLIYGQHSCINVVSHLPGEIGGVLIRAIVAECEIRDLPGMKTNYYGKQLPPSSKIVPSHLIASGPGRVCKALSIYHKDFNRRSLLDPDGELFLAYGSPPDEADIAVSSRVRVTGNTNDKQQMWRFYIKDHTSVSEPKWHLRDSVSVRSSEKATKRRRTL